MAIATLSYSGAVEGWPSFFSYEPESMVGLNNQFFSVKNGKLYLHDKVEGNNYAQFYGVDYDHNITLIMNDSPSQNLLFKALKIESTDPLDVLIETDLQTTGFIDWEWFEEREGAWYSFIRNSGDTPIVQDEYDLRRIGGIGKSDTYGGVATARELTFNLSINIKEASVGDALYFSLPPYTEPQFCGIVTGVSVDKPNNVNKITFDDNIPGTATVSAQDALILFAKNSIAESQGVLGHYAKITLSRTLNSSKMEIYSVEPDVMLSYT